MVGGIIMGFHATVVDQLAVLLGIVPEVDPLGIPFEEIWNLGMSIAFWGVIYGVIGFILDKIVSDSRPL